MVVLCIMYFWKIQTQSISRLLKRRPQSDDFQKLFLLIVMAFCLVKAKLAKKQNQFLNQSNHLEVNKQHKIFLIKSPRIKIIS